MGRLLCLAGIHSWRRITAISRHYATGVNSYRVECRHCARNKLRRVVTWED